MTIPSVAEIVRYFLYGANSVPTDFSSDSLIRNGADSVVVSTVSADQFMSGPGRFALGSSSRTRWTGTSNPIRRGEPGFA